MFSVVFPGQGSQYVGMGREFYIKFDVFKKYFKEADDILDFPLSKIILDGPDEKLNLTENTQPAVFLVSYCIYNLIKENFNFDLSNAKYFAGHSLGEYTAAACSGMLSFSDTIKILKIRGKAMQNSVPNGEGGMLAILGSDIKTIENFLENYKSSFECFIANDNSNGQIVASGTLENINKLSKDLTSKNIKNIKLSVSAPFHCNLMNKASPNLLQSP